MNYEYVCVKKPKKESKSEVYKTKSHHSLVYQSFKTNCGLKTHQILHYPNFKVFFLSLMKKNAIDHQNNEKKNIKRKKSQCFSKKTFHVCVPKISRKNMCKSRKYGVTRIYVYVVCNFGFYAVPPHM